MYDYYLAGPISGPNREENIGAFLDAARRLRTYGCSVFCPPEDEPELLSWEDALRRDIPHLLKSHAVCVLPGWESSRGVSFELYIADTLQIPRFIFAEVCVMEEVKTNWAKMNSAAAAQGLTLDPSVLPGNYDKRPMGEAIRRSVETAMFTEGRTFSTGSVRDTVAGKGRFDLLPPRALREVAKHFQRGAEKYGERNWEKGQPIRASFLDSGFRHLCSVLAGETNEDHLVACAWNILCAIDTRERVKEGLLPQELNDL